MVSWSGSATAQPGIKTTAEEEKEGEGMGGGGGGGSLLERGKRGKTKRRERRMGEMF